MNSTEKKAFVAQLLGSVQKEVETLIDCGHFPDAWDGHELREWLADVFTRERSSSMLRARARNQRRWRSFKEVRLARPGDTRPLVNWQGKPFDQCYQCGQYDTRRVDDETRECKDCGEHYAVEHCPLVKPCAE